MNELSDEAKAARAAYQREYRRNHPGVNKEYHRKWLQNNPEAKAKYNADYWERKAIEANSDESIDIKVLKLHKQGLSLRDIAARVGVNHVKVSRILKTKQ